MLSNTCQALPHLLPYASLTALTLNHCCLAALNAIITPKPAYTVMPGSPSCTLHPLSHPTPPSTPHPQTPQCTVTTAAQAAL